MSLDRSLVEAERARCARAVDAEEELTGPMPDAVWKEMATKEGAELVLRAVVRSTKRNIKRRVEHYDVFPA